MLGRWLHKARSFFRQREIDAELEDEIRTHLEMAAEEYEGQGMTPREAQLAARRSFGRVDRVKEHHRDVRRFRWLEDVAQDARLALRAFRKNPTFTAVTVLTLTVGIGANTAIFSVVEGVLIKPLLYPEAERLVTVAAAALPRTGVSELAFSEAGFRHLVENNRSFVAVGAVRGSRAWRNPIVGDGPPHEVTRAAMQVSAFEVLGVMPELGRLPTRDEERRVPLAPVVLMSHGLWVDHYGSDPSIIGRMITLRDWRVEVIGVMPEGFDFPRPDVDVWTLLSLDPDSEDVAAHALLAVGRLGPGITVPEAATDVESIIASFGELGYRPQRLAGLFNGRAVVRPLKDDVVGTSREPLLIALGTTLFVLLVACSTVANLLLVRAEARTREYAVRTALGAGRARLIQSIMMESVLLAIAGGVGGIGLAFIGTRVLVAASPASIPRLEQIGIDANVLLFTAAISIVAGLFFSLVPAIRAGSNKSITALRSGGRHSTPGSQRNRVLNTLVVAQTAFALVLLVGSGLMVRSFQHLHSVDPGFDSGGVLTFQLAPSVSNYPGDFGPFYYPLFDRLAALPGVTSVGGASSLPLTGVVATAGSTLGPVEIEEFPSVAGGLRPNFLTTQVMPGYFETMGVPIHEGRELNRSDDHPNYVERAFVISASVKRRYWPDESALGKRLTHGLASGVVVGVAGDVHHASLEAQADEIIYLSKPSRAMMIAVRTAGDPNLLVPGIRSAVESVDPDVPVTHVQTMDDIVADSVNRISFTMTLLLLAAGVALFLGSVGIYGVVSYVVSQRASEIGVRLALGATPGRVRNLVLSRGVLLAGLGGALGLMGSVALGGVLDSLLFRVSPFDFSTLLVASAVLIAMAAISSVIPATRASRTSPAIALRADG